MQGHSVMTCSHGTQHDKAALGQAVAGVVLVGIPLSVGAGWPSTGKIWWRFSSLTSSRLVWRSFSASEASSWAILAPLSWLSKRCISIEVQSSSCLPFLGVKPGWVVPGVAGAAVSIQLLTDTLGLRLRATRFLCVEVV